MYNSIITESELMDSDVVFTSLMESVGLSTEVINEAFDIRGFINRIKELLKKLLERVRSFFFKKRANCNRIYEYLNKLYRDNYDIIKKNYNTDWSIQGYTYDDLDAVIGNTYNVFKNKVDMLTVKKIQDDIDNNKYMRNNDNNINSYNDMLLSSISKAIGHDNIYNNTSELVHGIYLYARHSESPIKISKRNYYLGNIEDIIRGKEYKPIELCTRLSNDIQMQIQEDLKHLETLERNLQNDQDSMDKRSYMQLGIKCISFQKSLLSSMLDAFINLCTEELNQTKKIIELLIHLKNDNIGAKNEMGIFTECSFI